MEDYRYVKKLRPDLYRKVVEVGSIVTCSETPKDWTNDRYTIGAKVENRVMEIVAQLLDEYTREKP